VSTLSRRWVVAGGGTGGHVTPALALAERIVARGDEVAIFGSTRGLETRLVPEAGVRLVTLPARPMMGRGVAGRLAALPSLASACARAWRILGSEGSDVVVSVGGYASVPAVVAAAARRIPVALLEPNAIPGRANRYAARFARRIFVGFEAAIERMGAAPERVEFSGIPLRQRLVDAFGAGSARRRPEAPFHLLIFGGSQGARQLNEAMLEAAPALAALPLEIFHQTGEADRERVAAAYEAAKVSARVVAIESDMPAR